MKKLDNPVNKDNRYEVWHGMKARCTNPNNKDYRKYGGNGITICDRWAKSSKDFFKDMGPRPSLQHTIDRIDNNGNYEPGNCRWATKREQALNRSTKRLVTHNGITKNLIEHCRDNNLSFRLVATRLSDGWSIEKSLTKPVRSKVR